MTYLTHTRQRVIQFLFHFIFVTLTIHLLQSSADDDEEEEEAVRISNTPVMLGLCEVICILWTVIQPELDKVYALYSVC